MNTLTAKLDKRARDALPDDQFAVPGKRKLPICDERHTKLAWDMVDMTSDLTVAERRTARERILASAQVFSIDTKDWNRVKVMKIEGMSLNISEDDHPNKMPFTGVLTKVDEPSDAAPGGSFGRRVIVTADAARAALGSLLGMAVDFTPSFDGHDAQAKIGIITSADVVGNEVRISGFVYAADFPDTAEMIKALKDVLGFSFEAQRLRVRDMSADILVVTELVFTGAAILRKEKAAYQTTSLAANATHEDMDMTKEELQAILGEALKPITDRLTQVEASTKTTTDTLAASAAIRAKVEPHCDSIDAIATAISAAGIGTDASNGHAVFLRRIADAMRADAAAGKSPTVFRASSTSTSAEPDMAKLIADAVTAAVKPLQDELAAAKTAATATETKLKDLETKGRLSAGAPERKTMAPAITALLARAGIEVPEEGKTLKTAEVDKLLSGANLSLSQRLMVKGGLDRAGVLA